MSNSRHPTALSGLPLDSSAFERIKSQSTVELISHVSGYVDNLVLDVHGLNDYSKLLYDKGEPEIQGLARQTMMNMFVFDAHLTEIGYMLEALSTRLNESGSTKDKIRAAITPVKD